MAFSTCAYSGPISNTGGSISLGNFDVSFSLFGDGFSASGFDDAATDHCGACFAPFQLVNPVPGYFRAANGTLFFGGKSYLLPGPAFAGGTVPWAVGPIFLSPQVVLPTVTGAGTFDIPFVVDASFCVTDNPPTTPPNPPNPACFSPVGTTILTYQVLVISTPNLLFQPIPTVGNITPEPGTLGAGMLVMLLVVAAKRRTIACG